MSSGRERGEARRLRLSEQLGQDELERRGSAGASLNSFFAGECRLSWPDLRGLLLGHAGSELDEGFLRQYHAVIQDFGVPYVERISLGTERAIAFERHVLPLEGAVCCTLTGPETVNASPLLMWTFSNGCLGLWIGPGGTSALFEPGLWANHLNLSRSF